MRIASSFPITVAVLVGLSWLLPQCDPTSRSRFADFVDTTDVAPFDFGDADEFDESTSFALSPSTERRSEPPITLTSPDGVALELSKLHSETVVEGPLAYTELRLAFHNTASRTVEGRFRIALPPRASLARLAMHVSGAWQEGEVLERKLATVAYEDSLHRKIDPALLEAGAGNSYSARIFPIAPKETKHIVVGYSQVITSGNRVVVPLRGLSPVSDAHATLWRSGQPSRMKLTEFASDLLISPPTEQTDEDDARRSGDLVALRVRPVASDAPSPVDSLVVLVDTSASRVLDFADELEVLRGLVARLSASPGARLAIIAYDQSRELVFQGLARDVDEEVFDKVARRHALGASDLGAALALAGKVARADGLGRVLILGDGVVTAGSRGPALLATARNLREDGVSRLDAIAFGGLRDDDLLQSLATSGMKHHGVVGLASLGVDVLWSRLGRSVRDTVSLGVEGASWVHPREVRGLAAGEEVVVLARLPETEAPRLTVDGQPVPTPKPSPGSRTLLERAAASAELDELTQKERELGSSEELRHKIIDLSTRHRVMSPHTALLVLESEADYRRLGIPRDSLAPILTVASGQLGQAPRHPPPDRADASIGLAGNVRPHRAISGMEGSAGPVEPSEARPRVDPVDSVGTSGLGLSGLGAGGAGKGSMQASGGMGFGHGAGIGFGSGFGSGSGRLSGSQRSRGGPTVRLEGTNVSIAMPKEVVVRIIRQNYGRFRVLYESALLRDPTLAGEVLVSMGISKSGEPLLVAVNGPGPRSFHEAIGRVFWALRFPATEGGAVSVQQKIRFGSGPTSGPTSETLIPKPPGGSPDATRPPPSTASRWTASAPHEGPFAEVMALLERSQVAEALEVASRWHGRSPQEPLAFIALGEALRHGGQATGAARAEGSLIDLYPDRIEVLRYAASRLLRVKERGGVALALDALARARADRPDHPTSHRLHAYALLAEGRHAEAFAALRDGFERDYPAGRFLAVKDVLGSDLALVATAWRAARPADASAIDGAMKELKLDVDRQASRRFVLSWESDANDIDLHVFDDHGGHAWFSSPTLPRGGRLLADVTTGYGPEMFLAVGPHVSAERYRIAAHVYDHGPMGFGMGRVQIVDHDGKGAVSIEERPFVIMSKHGMVSLGTVPAKS